MRLGMIYIYHKLGFMNLQETGKAFTMEYKNVFASTHFGDDVIAQVSKEIPWFNQQTVALAWLTYLGVTMTCGAHKDAIESDYISIQDVSFLKRKFSIRNNHVFAPLNQQAIIEMLNWRMKTTGDRNHLQQVSKQACMEAVHWGETYYEQVRTSVNNLLRKFDLPTENASYHLMVSQYSRL
jgi:hypothetical protein